MAEPKTVQFKFPLQGVSRRASLAASMAQDNPTAPWTVNCRPDDPFEGRRRGGSRPGIAPYLGGGEPSFPTGELLTETGEEIWTETGDTIEVPIEGAAVLYPELLEAMQAFGYENLTDSITATVGTAPTGTIGCIYRDRLVVAGGNLIYMSRQGDYTDWDYGGDVEDKGRAFVFQASEAAELGTTITALVPHRDASLLVATSHGLWVMKGDPADSGTLQNVSRNVGIVSAHAWTKVDDSIAFLAWDGLWIVGADGSGLKSLSEDKLPEELSDIDPLNYTVMMGYRHVEDGIYLFVEGDVQHWFFDLKQGGFWPFRLPVTVTAAFIADGELVIQDSTGALWTFDGEDDNGTDIQSHVLFGPFQASSLEYTMLSQLHGTVQLELDGTMTWRIITGTTAEQTAQNAKDAIDNYLDGETTEALLDVVSSGTWVDGRQVMAYPRTRGMWLVLWLSSNHVWAFENLFATMRTLGRWRG